MRGKQKNKAAGAAIEKLRTRIDKVDRHILELLNSRACLVMDVGRAKAREKSDFYVPEREREVYRNLLGRNKGPFPNNAVKSVFREIMSASLSLEHPIKIAFLGPVATFTHQACLQHFGSSGDLLPKKEIEDVFDDVEKGRADFGVVPIENTIEGVVNHTLDMLATSSLKICAEVMLEVSLALMNKSGKMQDIKKVCSRPHALAESKNWLKNNLPRAALIDVSSTALGAQMASVDAETAAIASLAAAPLYGLRIIEKNIQDSANNITRFLVISKRQHKKTGSDKTSIMFSVKDAPGALYAILKPFAKKNINLTKIESRPVKTKAWEYLFFVDLDGHLSDKKVKDALAELERGCSFLKVLGSYPKSQ
ncbi:MAG: prephenate dehydratase [Deltaproteobacteria bacterium]|nr:prephenate dehydratase [Deltaproteobacteria bacterium]